MMHRLESHLGCVASGATSPDGWDRLAVFEHRRWRQVHAFVHRRLIWRVTIPLALSTVASHPDRYATMRAVADLLLSIKSVSSSRWRQSVHVDIVAWAVIAAIYITLVGAKLLLLERALSAFNFPDEWLYRQAAEDLARHSSLPLNPFPYTQPYPYPPLYPLLIAPAFLFTDWFGSLLRINALVSSLTVIPVWLIARTVLGRPLALLAVVVSATEPYQVIYPRMVFSENLYLPLFLLAVALIVALPRLPLAHRAVALGVVLGLCQLTRHLNLVLLPVFAGLFFVFHGRSWRALGVLAIVVAIVVTPWVALCVGWGNGVGQAVGLGIAVGQLDGRPSDIRALAESLPLWLAVYTMTLWLLAAPYLPALLSGRWWAGPSAGPLRRLAIVLALTTTTVTATAATFLWLYFSSDWRAAYVEERYVSYALPLVPALALAILARASLPRGWRTWGMYAAGLTVSVSAYLVLLTGQVWPEHPFVRHPVTSPHLAALTPDKSALVSIAGLLLMGSLVLTLPLRRWGRPVCIAGLAAGLLLINGASVIRLTAAMDLLQSSAYPGRILAPHVLTAWDGTHPVTVWLDRGNPGLPSTPSISGSIRFWTGAAPEMVVLDELPPPGASGLLLSRGGYQNPLDRYTVNGTSIGVYRLPLTSVIQPVILQLGPAEIQAGESFYQQADGSSAAWLLVSGLTASTVVVLDGVERSSNVDIDHGLVSCVVPASVTAQPGRHMLTVRDTLTGQESDPVWLTVR